MKPWLLNVLACPICQEHPLTVYVLQVEDFKLEKPELLAQELVTQYQKGVLSEAALNPVHNQSGYAEFDDRLAAARKAFAGLAKQKPSTQALLPLVRYFHGLEVQEGALLCPKCQRWYPLGSRIQGIPELLPDAQRDKKPDLAFLKKHRKTLPKEIVSGAKPYALNK